MRRTSYGAVALLAAACIIVSNPMPVSAAQWTAPDIPMSTWDQPGSAPLDGIGMYLYVPTAPGNYDYTLQFSYEQSSSVGAVGLGSGPNGGGGKFVALATGGSATVITPYEWSEARLYFLLAHRLDASTWGAWVYDVWADAWTFVGQGQTPVEWGRLSPRARTAAEWEGPPGSDCAAYPRTDAYVTPPIGVRDGSFTLGTWVSDTMLPYGCPSETSSYLGWAHYRLGG